MSAITPESVWAVVLAAGTSSRLGQPKQLLDLGGEPVLNYVLRAAAMSRVGGTVLVLGHEATLIGSRVGDFDQRTVVNPDFADGQSTSLKAGVSALLPSVTGALVLLGDQPLVTPALIDQLIQRHIDSERTDRFVQTRYGDIPAPPVLIGREWFEQVELLTGDQGARDLIRQHRDRCDFIDSEDDQPFDLDTLDDYHELLRRVASKTNR